MKTSYIKSNFVVNQKNLTAQWAFPVARLEEFLSLFQQAVYNVAADRLSYADPIDNAGGAKHPKDARVFVSAMMNASEAERFGWKSSVGNCEVDYFFWIISGTVFFGCVLPSSEKIQGLEYRTWKDAKGKRHSAGLKWVRTPSEIMKGRFRMSGRCLEGSIPAYVKLLSFKPGEMVGIQKLAENMVKNPVEREWALKFVSEASAKIVKAQRENQVSWIRLARDVKKGGVGLIQEERVRQMVDHGYNGEHDDGHVLNELARAAQAYATPGLNSKTPMPAEWPATWAPWWRPSDDAVENLSRAGALIAAEIDRILRWRQGFGKTGVAK